MEKPGLFQPEVNTREPVNFVALHTSILNADLIPNWWLDTWK